MISNSWMRITSWAAGLVAVAAALYILQHLSPWLRPILDVALPFSVAIGIALLLDPIITRLARRMPRGVAVATVALAFLAVVVAVAWLLIPAIIAQGKTLAGNSDDYSRHVQSYVEKFVSTHESQLHRLGLPSTMKELSDKVSRWSSGLGQSTLSGATAFISAFAAKAIWLVIIPIVTIFLLADIDRLKRRSLLLVPEPQRERTAHIAGSIGRVFGSYLRGILTNAALYGMSCGILIWAMGVDYAVILGVTAGVLSLVPFIGTITTLTIVVVVTLVTHQGPATYAVVVALALLFVNQVFDNVIGPRILGKAVGIKPALTIFALLVGSAMAGIPGMILAVPVAASIQLVVLELYPPLRDPEEEERKPRWSIFGRLPNLLPRSKKQQAK